MVKNHNGKLTIVQKMSNTGSIYDIASQHHDIVIDLSGAFAYAVVVPSYYNVPYTRHKTFAAAQRRAHLMRDYGPTILDKNTN